MEKFNKDILVGETPKTFQFTRMQNMVGVKFFVTTFDENNKPISFSLREDKYGKWALTPGSLPWLYEITAELNEAIEETQPA
jgi:hypothetical protein